MIFFNKNSFFIYLAKRLGEGTNSIKKASCFFNKNTFFLLLAKRCRLQLLGKLFVDRIPLSVMKFENVGGPFEVGLTFDLFLFEMRNFPARVLKLAQKDVGVLD